MISEWSKGLLAGLSSGFLLGFMVRSIFSMRKNDYLL